MEAQSNTETPVVPVSTENQEQQLTVNDTEKPAVPLSEKPPLSSENISSNGNSEKIGSNKVGENLPIPISGKPLTSSENICPITNSPDVNKGAIKKRREGKRKMRDQRSWENLLESLISLPDTQRIHLIREKYNELYAENKTATSTLKIRERQVKCLEREKEQVEFDFAKNVIARSKLEDLARELQKQNKEIKEENYNRLKDEEEKRKEVAASFTEKLNALTHLMDENKDKSVRLRNENINMTSKLTELYEQFQDREQHLSNMNRQMELQKKLSETQVKKLECEFEAEREIWKKERALMITNLERSDETNKLLQEKVCNLQEYLNTYQKQYSEFETTMTRGNKVFEAIKTEMLSIKQINTSLEKERNEWQRKWDIENKKYNSLMEVQRQNSNDLEVYKKKQDALEKLCRQLTAERQYYIQELKQSNINPDTTVVEQEDKVPQTPENNSVE